MIHASIMHAPSLAERIAAFTAAQESKTVAAQLLQISRMNLYRYIRGVRPGEERYKAIDAILVKHEALGPAKNVTQNVSLSRKSVTLLREVLVQLVEAIDLDLRDGDIQVIAPTNPTADRRQGYSHEQK